MKQRKSKDQKQLKQHHAEEAPTANKLLILFRILCPLIGGVCICFVHFLRSLPPEQAIGNTIISLLLILLCEYLYNIEKKYNRLLYNNAAFPGRYLFSITTGIIFAMGSSWLPYSGWPYLVWYLILTFCSNALTGICSATALLLISCLLSGASISTFCVYFVSGIFCVCIFGILKADFKIGIPFFLSLFCLIVCETAQIVLQLNSKIGIELFVVPITNVIISGILMIGFLKMFSTAVIYRYRSSYLDINDTENPFFVEYRQKRKKDYMLSIHSAYFCERIALRLDYPAEPLKTAAYYYRFSVEQMEKVKESYRVPPAALAILEDYENRKKGICHKQTAVLLCSDLVISSISYLKEKKPGDSIDYDKLIDTIFHKLMTDHTFENCDIPMSDLCTMQRLFKEEKLYYDFLYNK